MPTAAKPANAHTAVSTGWTNASNAFTDNTSAATALNGTTSKNVTHSGDYGFPAFTSSDIPDDSTIDAVRVFARGFLSATGPGVLLGIEPRNPAGTAAGSEATETSATSATTIQAVYSTLPSLADLRSAGTLRARCRGSKGNTSSAFTVSLEHVFIEVDYTEPAGGPADIDATTLGMADGEAAGHKLVIV